MAELSTYGMQQVLSYPFKDPRWRSKIALGVALTVAGMFVPVIPALFVLGYGYRILRRVIVERGDPYLPDWDDWGTYFKDGWRLFAVWLIYFLPAILASLLGIVAYIGMFIAMIAAEESGNDAAAALPMFITMGVLFLSMALSMLLSMAAAVLLPPATAHVVANDSFSAAFDFNGWWKILKANFGGFFLAIVIVSGVMGVIYFISYIFYMTIVLMCLMFILPLIFSFYMMLVGYALFGLAYREGVDRLNPVPAAVVEPVAVAEETPKPKVRRVKKVE